jgi:NAD(P)-dependent dehydrogenase (short-subunit alcohol dehydrogenase family)
LDDIGNKIKFMLMRLKQKVAVVTGAADGIGLAIGEAFLQEGAILIAGDINEEKCRAEAGKLGADGGVVRAVKCDVGVTADVNRMMEAAVSEFGRIDILVNNAAISIRGNIMEMPESDWDQLMNTNLKSVYRTIKAALPHMIRQRSGSVINIASAQAHRSWHDWTAYAAAKGAILSMTNQLAGQFGEYNVRFNSLSPGAIMTPMNEERARNEGPDFLSESAQMHALKRMGTPREVAMAAVFLASEDASFILGSDIKVDGGLCTLPRQFE